MRRWDRVDSAIWWATSAETSPQEAHGIDTTRMLSIGGTASTRDVTVRGRPCSRGGIGPGFADRAADRARIQAVIWALGQPDAQIVIAWAQGYGYREIARWLRATGRGERMTALISRHRRARGRVEARLCDLGYVEDL